MHTDVHITLQNKKSELLLMRSATVSVKSGVISGISVQRALCNNNTF